MSCDPYEWTCARCGKTHCNPFFTCYPREFWKDNKKRVGEVCEKCRDEIDYDQVRPKESEGRRSIMSYDIRLCDPVTHETLEVDPPHLMAGGTYALGGTTELWLNVTYNYGKHYRCMGERGIREIYGKTGAESIPMLKAAALRLGNDVSDDYWEATEGNAKRALLQLLAMARIRPDGVWDGD